MLTLRQVLGNSISSPPRTPSPGGSPGQLAPREPSYITSTYKPPSLYPNKKQRMEPLYSGVAANGPRFAPSTTLEPTTSASSMRSSVQFPPMNSTHVRRTHAQSVGSPPWSSQDASARSGGARTHENAPGQYQNADQPPVEPSFPRRNPFTGTAPDPFARQMRDSFGQSGDRPSSRRSSVSTYAMYPPPSSFDREQPRPSPYSAGSYAMRDGYSDPRDPIRYGRPEEHQDCQPGFPAQPYQSNVPAYFMPSHYEYQHGKARKRSNLPKQSTEIMKTWFDQVWQHFHDGEEQARARADGEAEYREPLPQRRAEGSLFQCKYDAQPCNRPLSSIYMCSYHSSTGNGHQYDSSEQLVHQPPSEMSRAARQTRKESRRRSRQRHVNRIYFYQFPKASNVSLNGVLQHEGMGKNQGHIDS